MARIIEFYNIDLKFKEPEQVAGAALLIRLYAHAVTEMLLATSGTNF